jgi:Rrf2 family protein
MYISTRGRYALRVMVDIAEHQNGGFITLKEVAERQELSEKYLESIMKVLVSDGIIEGARGKGGGYRLIKSPEEYIIGDILRSVEGSLTPVVCIEDGAVNCDRASDCRTLPLWQELYDVVINFFDSKTLADLMKKPDNE